MSNFEDYQSLIGEIESIENDQIKNQSMPFDKYLQEAEIIDQVALPDKDLFINTGMPEVFFDEFPLRISACRYAQTVWVDDYNSKNETEKEWAEKSLLAYE